MAQLNAGLDINRYSDEYKKHEPVDANLLGVLFPFIALVIFLIPVFLHWMQNVK
jgi:hypothetical protein